MLVQDNLSQVLHAGFVEGERCAYAVYVWERSVTALALAVQAAVEFWLTERCICTWLSSLIDIRLHPMHTIVYTDAYRVRLLFISNAVRLLGICYRYKIMFRLSVTVLVVDTQYVLINYKTEICRRPHRLCRQGYACPSYHNLRDKRRSPRTHKYRFVVNLMLYA